MSRHRPKAVTKWMDEQSKSKDKADAAEYTQLMLLYNLELDELARDFIAQHPSSDVYGDDANKIQNSRIITLVSFYYPLAAARSFHRVKDNRRLEKLHSLHDQGKYRSMLLRILQDTDKHDPEMLTDELPSADEDETESLVGMYARHSKRIRVILFLCKEWVTIQCEKVVIFAQHPLEQQILSCILNVIGGVEVLVSSIFRFSPAARFLS
ncbi:hypothetical protein GQ44DRAFT_828636 [Phaeosphaeriaceae sp. PMI808]|nr:hypothetical protein GQ44DRAFT_828636 [Phaeosphaeriaceae sp. PMI808]